MKNMRPIRKLGKDKRQKLIWHVSVLVALAIVLASFTFSFLSTLEITGFGTVSQPTYQQDLHLTATGNQEYGFRLKTFPENASLSSLGLSGSIIGDGKVKVYLISDTEKLLVLDSDEVKQESSGITGFSAADKSASSDSGSSDSSDSSSSSSEESSAQPAQSEPSSDVPSSDNAATGPPSSDTTDNSGSDTEPSGPGADNSETPPAETPPAEIPPVEQPPAEIPPTEIPPTEQPPAEEPPVEQPPAEVPGEEIPEENITVPEENVTLPEENITLPEENLTIQEYSFENFCIDTCYLPEGFTDDDYILEIEVEPGTTLKLDSVIYDLSLPEIPIVENQTNETVFFETTIVDANNNAVPAVIEFVDSQTNDLKAIGMSEEGDKEFEAQESNSPNTEESSAQPELPSSSTDNASIGSDTEPSNSGAENSPDLETPEQIPEENTGTLIQGAAVAEPETAQPTEGPIVEASGEPGIDIPKGKYNIKVKLQNSPIQEITFNDIDVTQNITDFIKIDNPSEVDGFVEVYVIDPTQFNFTRATVTGIAVGDSLYKCKDWDFVNQICTGNWAKIMDLTPGQEYSFVLTPEDPAYAQMPITNCAAENRAAKGSFGAACTVANGSSLLANDTSYELHPWNGSAAGGFYGGVRINSTNTSVTNCISVTQVNICYQWWANDSGAGPNDCDISVDANNGASYTAITTTCPGTTEPGPITCTNVTSNESWSCNNFFGASATGALAKSELGKTNNPARNGYGFWDVFYFNVSYNVDGAPNSTLVSPPNGNVTTSNNVTFACNATDDIKLSNITFYWNYTGTFQANGTTAVSGTSNQTTFNRTNLNNTAILWNCQACDNRSQCSFAPANFTVTINATVADATAPTIAVITPSPGNNSFMNSTTAVVNASVVDAQSNISVCTLNFDGSNSTMTKNGAGLSVTCNSTQSSLSQGPHNFTVFANDTINNMGQNGTWFFTVDTIFPQVQFVAPTETPGIVLNRTNVLVNVTATDLNLTNITIYVYNSTSLINSTTTLASPNFVNFTNLTNGLYYFNATALDLAGNLNSTETRNVTINADLPPTSDSPLDQTVDLGQKSTIVWILQDDVAPGYYYVLKDGALFDGPYAWSNNTQIIVRPNNFFLGNHNYTIYYNDSAGNNGTPDTVFVNVADSSTPSCSGVSSPLTLTNITIDGNVNDWFAVLSNSNNYRHDEPSGSGDLDVVGTADRDLTEFAYTWDSQYLYFYFKRVTSGTNVISVMAYLDYGLDGYMNSTDKVIKFIWHGSNGQWDSDLYNYNPVGVGDLMNGSGYDLPGSITENQSLEDNIPGSTSPGIQLEARVAWSALGFSGPRAINFQPASALGTGTNLPSQLEDNVDTVSSQYARFLFSPNNTDSANNGTSVYYTHDLMNCGISSDTFDMTKVSDQGWTITLYYPNGTALTDTDSDGKVDMPLGTNSFTTLIAKIDVPSATFMGVVDVSTITATSSVASSVSKSVKDTTATGQIGLAPSTRTIYGAPGMTAVLNYTVYNYQSFADVIEIEANSNQGWTANLYYANGTSVTDTDSDAHADVGSLLAGESKDIVVKLSIPSGASIGTNDLTTIRINSSVAPSVTTTASTSTTVKNRLTIEPDYNRSIGLGESTYYLLTITNSWNQSDTIDLTHTYVLNWNTTFYDYDSVTLLTDTDSDSKVDIGPLSGYGTQKDIYAKVSSPSNATNNQNETTTVYANSSLSASVYDTAVLRTTARTVNTFANVARTTPKTNFEVGDVVYARAFNLLSVANAYYQWIDSNSTVLRISSNIAVDANLQADDQLSTNASMLLGTWAVVVFNANTNVELGRINFVLNDTTAPSISIIRPQNTTYNNRTQLVNISTSGASSVWYNWNGTNIPYTIPVYVTFGEGSNTLHAYANDTFGNLNSTSITFTTDTIAPVITNIATNPAPPIYNNGSTQNITTNFTSSEYPINITFYIYYSNGSVANTQGPTTITNSGQLPVNYTIPANLPDGNYTVNMTAADSMGNNATVYVGAFTVDKTKPLIQFVYPTETSGTVLTNRSNIQVNVTATDANLANITVRFYNSTSLISSITTTTSPNFNDFTSLPNGIYFVNATAYDYAGNLNSTATSNVTINITTDSSPPTITNLFPANNSLDPNGNIIFNASVTDNVALKNASLYINGILNQTQNLSGTSNITSFNLNLPNGNYNWSLRACDNRSNCANSEIYLLIVNTNVLPIYTNFTGNTTDWPNVPDLTNVCNGTAIIDNPITDKIQWHSCINASGQNFDINVNLSYNFVDVDFGLNPTFNSSATITIRGLPWDATPDILIDGVLCSPSVCQNIVYNVTTGLLVFDVPHFTNFTTQGNSRLEIWDETDTGMPFGGQTKYPNDWVKFFANYTKKTDGTPFLSATCIINFTDSSGNSMTYNATSSIYEYNRTFSTSGIKPYNVTCSKTGAQTITLTDSANISVAPDNPSYWSNNQSSIVATYSPSTPSYFNITWGDDAGVSKVYFESNYSGSAQNYSMNLISGGATNGVYNYSAILPAGTWYWKSHANDTVNQWNSSNAWSFTIAKATSACNLIFNPASSQIYGTAINASCSCTNPEASVTLYRNGVNVTETENNVNTVLAVQTHNYTCNVSASQNYNSASNSSNYIITQASPSGSLKLALNGVESNQTITYGAQSNATGWSDLVDNQDLTFNLYVNGGLVTSGDPASDVQTLAVGNYTYVYNTTGGTNYTFGSSPARLLIVDKATPILTLTASPAWNVQNGTQTNISCSANTPQVTPQLYRNGTNVSNPDVQTLAVGSYNYTCNNTVTPNYTSTSSSNPLIVTAKNISVCSLSFNPISPQTYPTAVNASCSCTNPEASATLYKDNVNVTATENNVFVSLAAENHSYVCNVTETGNWSIASNSAIYELDPATGLIYLYLNSSRANLTTSNNTNVNISAVLVNGTGNIQVYKNGTQIYSGPSPSVNITLFDVLGLHNITADYQGNQNYTADSEMWWVNVTPADSAPPIVSFVAPTPGNGGSVTDNNFTVNTTVEDALSSIDACILTISNSTFSTQIVMTNSGGTSAVCNATTTVLGFGTYNYSVFTNDTAGNFITTANRTVTLVEVDTIPPDVTLIGPANGTTNTNGSLLFRYNVTDTLSGIANCSLIINGAIEQTDTSVTPGIAQSFTSTLTDGDYTWSVNCTDTAGNENSSETRSFTVAITTELPVQISGPSAPVYRPPKTGGEGGENIVLYYIGDFALNSKYDYEPGEGQSWIYTYKDLDHTAKVVVMGADFVDITVRSTPSSFRLHVGETKQIDTDDDGVLDVKFTLNWIDNGKASITVELPKVVRFNLTFCDWVILLFILFILLSICRKKKHHHKGIRLFCDKK